MIIQPWENALIALERDGASVALRNAASIELGDLAAIRTGYEDSARIVTARLGRMIQSLQVARAEVLRRAFEEGAVV